MEDALSGHSIQPASGFYGPAWPASGAIPHSHSAGGWTDGNEGFVQQTFLGASVRSFNLAGGFGDSSSSLSTSLVADEYNKSDELGLGLGDDVYHNGKHDRFAPPPVGSPVFFKFGKNLATVEDAWRKIFDEVYGYKTITPSPLGTDVVTTNKILTRPDGHFLDIARSTIDQNNVWVNKQALYDPNWNGRGQYHLTFGGILQTYTQNRGPGGNPTYQVTVKDPREILANTTIILNNYGGTTFNNANLLNLYGFLEYDPSDALLNALSSTYGTSGILRKSVSAQGVATYGGFDVNGVLLQNQYADMYVNDMFAYAFSPAMPPPAWPITGKGYSRRSDKGIPYYRIYQGLKALFDYDGKMFPEYKAKGFGGRINFRGFNYVVDLTGIPWDKIPPMYFLDFDQINLLDLVQELCDVLSMDLFVNLFPVLNHPATQWLYDWNQAQAANGTTSDMVAGVIRVDVINRGDKPQYGAIKRYIDTLATGGVQITNQDVGYELSNITTDKFIVGAQEVDMQFFTTNADRDFIEARKQKRGIDNLLEGLTGSQWYLSESTRQQVLPFYGFLGKDAVTIPRGWGAYQQILLDATALNAHGVGNYYIATELELRSAMISYDRWKEFLLTYNDVYMESMEEDDIVEGMLLENNVPPAGFQTDPLMLSNNYGVAVPRCVWRSDRNYMGPDNLPASPCSPPFGYPLYYKRATKVGIPEAGLVAIQAEHSRVMTNLAKLKAPEGQKKWEIALNTEWTALMDMAEAGADLTDAAVARLEYLGNLMALPNPFEDHVGMVEDHLVANEKILKALPRIAKKTMENSLKVYNFVKNVATENLGKKFLVRMPRETNAFYSRFTTLKPQGTQEKTKAVGEIEWGPFGFAPRAISPLMGYASTSDWGSNLNAARAEAGDRNRIKTFLSDTSRPNLTYGALKVNYNPIADQYEFNYKPEPQGGYFEFDLYSNLMTTKQLQKMSNTHWPLGVQAGLVPQDLTNFSDDKGRVSAYVRFDNSQFLSLDGVDADSVSQQSINAAGFVVPDIVHELDNMQKDEWHSFDTKQLLGGLKQSVAFVKCTLDDKFYMSPKIIGVNSANGKKKTKHFTTKPLLKDKVWARKVQDIGQHRKPKKLWDKKQCKWVDSFAYYVAHYVPGPSGGYDGLKVPQEDFLRYFNPILKGEIIDTSRDNLDTDFVYALIELPGRVIPTRDSRMKDGPFQMMQAPLIKHYMTMDTVKGVRGFELPAVRGKPPQHLDNLCASFTLDSIVNSFKAYEAALEKQSFANPAQMHVAMPSPVYPDLVALPLMSKDRCYGPWISSFVDIQAAQYAGIGGRVDFEKEETLSPWDYAGYGLMNGAGYLKAQFSNSLLLFSERGGFVVADAPQGTHLGKVLTQGGPLVTNVNVDIGDAGVKTTYKMDLYTANFGKLQKQREDAVAQISRERQRLKDERNALIRKGLGKAQTSSNYGMIHGAISSILRANTMAQNAIGDMQKGEKAVHDRIVASVKPAERRGHDPVSGSGHSFLERGVEMASQAIDFADQVLQSFPTYNALRKAYYNSAGGTHSEGKIPASMEPGHNNMASRKETNYPAKHDELYKLDDNSSFDNSDTARPTD